MFVWSKSHFENHNDVVLWKWARLSHCFECTYKASRPSHLETHECMHNSETLHTYITDCVPAFFQDFQLKTYSGTRCCYFFRCTRINCEYGALLLISYTSLHDHQVLMRFHVYQRGCGSVYNPSKTLLVGHIIRNFWKAKSTLCSDRRLWIYIIAIRSSEPHRYLPS
jgi:hypothetical protein